MPDPDHYAFLIIATLAQLAVPNMVRRILDAVTGGYLANQVLTVLGKLPATAVDAALPAMLTALKYPQTLSAEQLALSLNETAAAAPQGILTGILAVLLFAVIRGVFAFLQAFWAEKNSQTVAYDLRNDLYAKIQRLSFSYHDRNQTGQLMIRATDDVEKVRLFIGQGLLQLVGAIILLVGTVAVLFSTNRDPALAAWLAVALRDPVVVAAGEMGLDYHYDFSPRDRQREAFEAQMALAADAGRPAVIHALDADADVAAVLRNHPRTVAILHSFSSGPDLLRAGVALGHYVSWSGMITFRRWDARSLVREVPVDRLLVETDAPYLAPVPHRGHRNEPAYVAATAARLAEVLGLPVEEVVA